MRLKAVLIAGCGLFACGTGGLTGRAQARDETPQIPLPSGYCAKFEDKTHTNWQTDIDWTDKLNTSHWAGRVKNSECFFDAFPLNSGFSGGAAHLGYLRAYYLRRAGIHRKMDSIGADVAFVGGTGAGLASKAGSSTVFYWGLFAVAPAYVSHFIANAPVQNLYVGGGAALEAITGRYRILFDYAQVQRDGGERSDRFKKLKDACDKVLTAQRETDGWKNVTSSANDLRSEVGRVVALCDAAKRQEGQLAYFERTFTRNQTSIFPVAYREDARRLDERIIGVESDLSPTPGSALSSVVDVPLQALVTAATGKDSKAAFDVLKTQSALTGLTANLARIASPPLPVALKTDEVVSADARRSLTAFGGKNSKPGPKRAGEIEENLEDVITFLNDYALAFNFDLDLAQSIRSLALYSHVTVTLDPTSAAITATLTSG